MIDYHIRSTCTSDGCCLLLNHRRKPPTNRSLFHSSPTFEIMTLKIQPHFRNCNYLHNPRPPSESLEHRSSGKSNVPGGRWETHTFCPHLSPRYYYIFPFVCLLRLVPPRLGVCLLLVPSQPTDRQHSLRVVTWASVAIHPPTAKHRLSVQDISYPRNPCGDSEWWPGVL